MITIEKNTHVSKVAFYFILNYEGMKKVGSYAHKTLIPFAPNTKIRFDRFILFC